MARKKKSNVKSNPKSREIQGNTDGQLPKDAPSGQQQQLSEPNSSRAYDLANNNSPAAGRTVGQNDKGKGKIDPTLGSTGHEMSKYQPDYREDPPNNQRQVSQGPSTSSFTQIAPQNWSRNGPSGGFFEGSNNLEIKGGRFNQTYGHHTNVTIHVNQPPEDEYNTTQQYLSPPPLASPSASQESNHNIAPSFTQDIYRGQFPSMSMYEQPAATPTTTYSPDNSNIIYERHLGLKRRGFPLWIPEPNGSLPVCYRRKGISIGDVGIITPSGAFSFLFNICFTHDDPINPPTLPEGFAPIYPPIHPLDIRKYFEFNPESYLASTTIEKIPNESGFRGLSFVTTAAEGAVLTLPDGAIALDLENIPQFRAYAAANIENWYRYINGPRGREAKNGEVRLVIGCDKTTSWGTAAVANLSQHKTHYLKYRSVGNIGPPAPPIPLYKWEYTGLAEARVGPNLQEIEDLKRSDDSDAAVDGQYCNQCLFVRTLNLTLNDDVFAAITLELESAQIQRSQQLYNRGGPSNSKSNPPSAGAQRDSTSQQSGTNSATRTRSAPADNLNIGNVVGERVSISRSPSAPKSHPADVLNKLLLQKVPNSRVVITQDEDWCSVLNKGDEIMPNPSEIAKRVLTAHHIREEDGVVFLEPKKGGAGGASSSVSSSGAAVAKPPSQALLHQGLAAAAAGKPAPSPTPAAKAASTGTAPSTQKISMTIQPSPPFLGGRQIATAGKGALPVLTTMPNWQGRNTLRALQDNGLSWNAAAANSTKMNANPASSNMNTNITNMSARAMPASPKTLAAKQLNAHAWSFRLNPKAKVFIPANSNIALPTPKNGPVAPSATLSPTSTHTAFKSGESISNTSNPFFGSRLVKKSTSVHLKDDFNPFKHNKIVSASQVFPIWPYGYSERYNQTFAPLRHPPTPYGGHMIPVMLPFIPPPPYENRAAHAAARQHIGPRIGYSQDAHSHDDTNSIYSADTITTANTKTRASSSSSSSATTSSVVSWSSETTSTTMDTTISNTSTYRHPLPSRPLYADLFTTMGVPARQVPPLHRYLQPFGAVLHSDTGSEMFTMLQHEIKTPPNIPPPHFYQGDPAPPVPMDGDVNTDVGVHRRSFG